MRKLLLPLVLSAGMIAPALAEEVGQVPEGEGKIFTDQYATVVRKTFSPDHPMKRHNHPGAQIILTVIKGQANIVLDETEKHTLHSGDILIFNGDHYISSEFPEETLITVTLVNLQP